MTGKAHAGVDVTPRASSATDRLSVRGAGVSSAIVGRWPMSSSDRGVEGGPSTLVRGEGNSRDVLTVQREEPSTHFAAVDAVRHDTQRRIVWALATQNGRVTYDDLDEVTTTSERTIRKHASNLVDEGLIERVNANFVFFEFASPNAEILTREALSRWYDLTES